MKGQAEAEASIEREDSLKENYKAGLGLQGGSGGSEEGFQASLSTSSAQLQPEVVSAVAAGSCFCLATSAGRYHSSWAGSPLPVSPPRANHPASTAQLCSLHQLLAHVLEAAPETRAVTEGRYPTPRRAGPEVRADYISQRAPRGGEGRRPAAVGDIIVARARAQVAAGGPGAGSCCCRRRILLLSAPRAMADTVSVHATRFEAAVRVIQSLPQNGSFQPTNEMMLKFYSFYKQATQGPCNIPRPGFWDPIGRYKWDAWSALGNMSKEEAMIAYVEEMKKILETMPMTEKVEELLQVLGPFYEMVEDKKSNRGSDLTSDLGNALTSTPNPKALNGKAESSDSGAESEEEEVHEEEKDLQLNANEYKNVKPDSAAAKDLERVVTNGCYKDSFIPDAQNGTQTKSALNGINVEEELKKMEQSLEVIDNNVHQGTNEESVEEVSGIQHLTSDSDSEVYCDSMEQLGQEEPLEIITSARGPLKLSSHFLEIDPSYLLESADFPEHIRMTSGNFRVEDIKEAAVEGKGEVKCGGEDGKSSNGGPHKEKKGGEKMDFYGVRRGRGHRLQPLGDGARGGQMGSGGDGERWGSDRGPRGSLNEQIALVLMRLQEDMQNVLQRLHALEALTASQARTVALQSNYQPVTAAKRPSWWPFEISPGTLTFAIVWPFIAQWLVHIYLQRRRRKLD